MKEKLWWKKTFNNIYLQAFDQFYSMQSGKKEASFITSSLKLKKNTHILDLACGQGRHAISFAQLGMRVTGVDASKDLLHEAKKRALKEKVTPSFTQADMRTYCEEEKYDVIILLGNSFGYFSDMENEQVLTNISSSLKKGGYFVLDLSNTVGMLRKKITGKWTQNIPQGKLTTKTIDFDPETFRLKIQWHIVQNKKVKVFDGILRLYTPPEIQHLLIQRNLQIQKTFGSFKKEGYSDKTKRYLIIARKNG